jgi:hypothetical protein
MQISPLLFTSRAYFLHCLYIKFAEDRGENVLMVHVKPMPRALGPRQSAAALANYDYA